MWLTGRRGLSAFCICLLFLSIFHLVTLATSQRGKFVNCKKMVFAPICRGVAAKRGVNMRFPSQPQVPAYSLRGAGQFMPTEKQTPYWYYQQRLAERTYP